VPSGGRRSRSPAGEPQACSVSVPDVTTPGSSGIDPAHPPGDDLAPTQSGRPAESGASAAPDRLAWRRWVGLMVLIALATAVRFLSLPALTAGGLRLVSMDDYGHLRRAVATVRDFPRVPVADPFLAHPEGGLWIWPPLFDLLIAAPAWAVFGSDAEVAAVTWVAALLPPALSALTILPLFFLGRRLGGELAGWAAAGSYALLPSAARWGAFGHADQHVAEALAMALVLAAFAALLEHGGGRRVVAAAAALATAVLLWQGAVFLGPLVAVASWWQRRAALGAAAFAGAAVLVLPWALARPDPVTYVSFSLFQPFFLLLLAAMALAASRPRWGPWVAGAGALALFALWPPVADGARHLLSATAGATAASGAYLAAPREWLELIAEYQPLWRLGAVAVLRDLGWGLLVVPVALVAWAATVLRRRGGAPPAYTLALAATVMVLAMALAQRRYTYYLAVGIALAVGWAVAAAHRRWGAKPAAALALVVLVSALPGLAALRHTGAAAGWDVFRTLEQLARLDPSPADPFRPRRVAPGEVAGVLAPWSLGHLVPLLTGRPSVADNFGYGFHRQAWVLAAPPTADAEVAEALRRWHCRYLVTTDLRPLLLRYARAAGWPPAPVEQSLAVRIHESFAERPVPFLETVLVSETATVTHAGTLAPRLRVFRVLEDPP
jgi:hypothetical protein